MASSARHFRAALRIISGALWSANKNPLINLDLGAVKPCATFGLNIHGYEGKDALRGEVQDTIEVFTSQRWQRIQVARLFANRAAPQRCAD